MIDGRVIDSRVVIRIRDMKAGEISKEAFSNGSSSWWEKDLFYGFCIKQR